VLRASLLGTDRAFARESQTRGLAAWTDFFADSGILMRPNAAVTPGKAFMQERMGAVLEDTSFSMTWEPLRADVSRSGDLGYTIGLYQARTTPAGGRPVITTGKYVTIWRRQVDGSWKVALDIGNPDGPQ
jgi:ketosteroid isomerase-like protein